jgi:hypothetical protein
LVQIETVRKGLDQVAFDKVKREERLKQNEDKIGIENVG